MPRFPLPLSLAVAGGALALTIAPAACKRAPDTVPPTAGAAPPQASARGPLARGEDAAPAPRRNVGEGEGERAAPSAAPSDGAAPAGGAWSVADDGYPRAAAFDEPRSDEPRRNVGEGEGEGEAAAQQGVAQQGAAQQRAAQHGAWSVVDDGYPRAAAFDEPRRNVGEGEGEGAALEGTAPGAVQQQQGAAQQGAAQAQPGATQQGAAQGAAGGTVGAGATQGTGAPGAGAVQSAPPGAVVGAAATGTGATNSGATETGEATGDESGDPLDEGETDEAMIGDTANDATDEAEPAVPAPATTSGAATAPPPVTREALREDLSLYWDWRQSAAPDAIALTEQAQAIIFESEDLSEQARTSVIARTLNDVVELRGEVPSERERSLIQDRIEETLAVPVSNMILVRDRSAD